MQATFKQITKWDEYTSAQNDRRKKVSSFTCAYFTKSGIEYRKRYEFPKYTTPSEVLSKIPKHIDVND